MKTLIAAANALLAGAATAAFLPLPVAAPAPARQDARVERTATAPLCTPPRA